MRLLDRKLAAGTLGVFTRTLDRLPESELPRVVVGKRRVLFRPDDLAAYVERRVAVRRDRPKPA
ncbi:MAG: hypothetical protein KGK10_05515 [Rhodospirillales bacterium]|nr:hypothetical protein [Rhodospirillales bacterium]